MRAYTFRFLMIAGFITIAQVVKAQGDGGDYTLPVVIGVAVFLGLWALITLADNLMNVEAKKVGIDTRKQSFGIFPDLTKAFGPKAPEGIDPSRFHALSKGADIRIAGKPSNKIVDVTTTRYAVQPYLYNGMSPIPKITVEIGGEVKAGDPIFFDKKRPEVQYVAPVSGEVVEVIRGEKRAIHKIVILADKDIKYKQFDPPALTADREIIVKFMLESGAWALLNQRPFDIVPSHDEVPRDIFVSTFDSAPLAPDMNLAVLGNEVFFQGGLDVLNKLTSGKVYLGINSNKGVSNSTAFENATGVEKHYFAGKHPFGNVGVQIHHIKPIRSGDKVWTLGVQEVITIGKLFQQGIYDASKLVSVTGPRVNDPSYVRVSTGASIEDILTKFKVEDHSRIIAGDVLSGRAVSHDDFLSSKEDQISTLEEGDKYELFGWLLPLAPRPSMSNTFPHFLFKNYDYEPSTNTHGEKRAFVVSGLYEEVTPMDIYPMHLMKAIMANDIEKMEGLGLYELSEEDLALAEFACVSKMPLQSILRQGLDAMREQE